MAIDLHTSLPSQFLPDDDHHHLPSPSHNNNNNNKNKSLPEVQMNHMDDDFIAELTHHMAHFTLPDDDTFDFPSTASHSLNSESSWDLNQGSPEGSSHEPSSPATPKECYWKNSYNNMFGMFEKMKLEEGESSKHYPSFEINHTSKSNTGLCSYQSLIQQQIRDIELSRLKQEEVVTPKPKPVPYRKSEGQVTESKQKVQQFSKKGNGRRARPPRPGPHQAVSGMRAVFLDGPGSTGGTGVFLPRGGPIIPSESTNKQGKGCSTVLIPARVVQALQLQFDQMAATSGPRAGGFPPLHDVLVSNRDGMYSLQKRQSRKAPASIQNDMILPHEWTY